MAFYPVIILQSSEMRENTYAEDLHLQQYFIMDKRRIQKQSVKIGDD